MSPDEGQEELEEVQAEIKKKDEEVSEVGMILEILSALKLHCLKDHTFGFLNCTYGG